MASLKPSKDYDGDNDRELNEDDDQFGHAREYDDISNKPARRKRRKSSVTSKARQEPIQEELSLDDFGDVDEVEEDTVEKADSPGWRVSNPDAVGLILLGIAAIVGASVWLDIAGPIGAAVAHAIHLVIGAGALVLPVALIALALALMLDISAPETGIPTRVIIGTTMIIVAMLGLIHLFAGNPSAWDERIAAGGAVGAWTGGLLAAGFSSYVAVHCLSSSLSTAHCASPASPCARRLITSQHLLSRPCRLLTQRTSMTRTRAMTFMALSAMTSRISNADANAPALHA